VHELRGVCGTLEGDEKFLQFLVAMSEGKVPLGGPRSRWKVNVRMALREIGWEGVVWMHVAEDRD
jgi:hypothetical protein